MMSCFIIISVYLPLQMYIEESRSYHSLFLFLPIVIIFFKRPYYLNLDKAVDHLSISTLPKLSNPRRILRGSRKLPLISVLTQGSI